MALEFIPREGLVVLQKKRLEHLKEKETGNENGRFGPSVSATLQKRVLATFLARRLASCSRAP